ncbi:hypothetical protein, partial [Acidovorax sp. HMWF018]
SISVSEWLTASQQESQAVVFIGFF